MNSDKTNAEFAPDLDDTRAEMRHDSGLAWQRISGGLDGDAYVAINRHGAIANNSSEPGMAPPADQRGELRVLTKLADDADRLRELRWRMRLMELADHPAIRRVEQDALDRIPPSIVLALPAPLDPRTDRLSDRIKSLSAPTRVELAVCLVEALTAAHRVGLHHNRLDARHILTAVAGNGEVVCAIDFTEIECCAPAEHSEQVAHRGKIASASRDTELVSVRALMRELLQPIFNVGDASLPVSVSREFEQHQIKHFIGDGQQLDEFEPPPLSQWHRILKSWSPTMETDLIDGMQITAEQRAVGNEAVDGNGVDGNATDGYAAGGNEADGVVTSEMSAADADRSATQGWQQTPVMTSRTTKQSQSFNLPPKLPERLGRFQLGEVIGEGGMGRVYRGRDLANQEGVAVKVLHQNGTDLTRAVGRFRKEARLLADVQNDHVTRLIEIGEDRGHHFIVMELIEGIDLKHWFAARATVDEGTALKLAADIARALVDAHARDVIHRDIKPENVLLQLIGEVSSSTPHRDRPLSDFRVKLTDFGIARHIDQSVSMELTPAGIILGTPRYMSPEQFDGNGEVRPTADVYSMGVALFELLTGEPPFRADEIMQLGSMHRHKAPPAVQQMRAEISDLTAALVARALAKDPAERFGDAAQMLAAIERILHGEAAEISAHPRAPESIHGKVWDKTKTWELASSPQELWPYVSNTQRLNHALGLPAVDYRTEMDPEHGLRQLGSFRIAGLHLAWEEHPFEWIECQRMGILREFTAGPFEWFLSTVTFEPTANGGTRLTHRVRITPRNLLGKIVTVLEADWKAFRNLDRVYRRMDRAILKQLTTREGSDPFEKPSHMAAIQIRRLDERLARVVDDGVAPGVANKLRTTICTGSPQSLAQLHPLRLASEWDITPQMVVDACLVAASRGLLQLRWDILCPRCRAAATTVDRLAEIAAHTDCEACGVGFQSNVEDAIEMVFRVHPEIREVNEAKYCIAGPEHAPHVVAQVRLEPGERLTLAVDLIGGNYLIRGPRLPRTQPLRVRDTSAPAMLEQTLSHFGTSIHVPVLRRGRQSITLTNDLLTLHVVRLERAISRDDVVTATAAASMPKFRELFPDQSFASSNPIATEQVTLLAMSINNMDSVYAQLGDLRAYTLSHELLNLAKNIISAHGGSVTRTMNAKLLAAFDRREQAVQAAVRIRDEWASRGPESSSPDHLQIGIGIHCGATLVTTENDRLDYFGATVRAVTALADQCGGGTLLTEVVSSDPAVEALLPEGMQLETVDLPGMDATRVRRIGQV